MNYTQNWFNTSFYYTLYKNRDYSEAKRFVLNLTKFLALPVGASVLDMACGRGRHSQQFNELGYDVTGIDLSENSIEYARRFENERLRFLVHDIRVPVGRSFDLAVNLFTSFGYGCNDYNLAVLKSLHSNLKANGKGVIDYVNVQPTIEKLVPEEEKTIDGIHFHIKRYVAASFICKDIRFEHQGEAYHFKEQIKILDLNGFKSLFEQTQLHLKQVFGDYELADFSEGTSPRLIMVVER